MEQGVATNIAGSTTNEKNKLLKLLDDLKWPGLNRRNFIKNAIDVLIANPATFASDNDFDNKAQIEFAKLIWNVASKEGRKVMLLSDNADFMQMASNPSMTGIIQDALDKFEAGNMSGKGDASAKAAYDDIVTKYRIAKAKESKMDAFSPQLTPGEERLIARFESRVEEEIQQHYPNENAVTYLFLLARMIHASKVDLSKKKSKDANNIVLDILMFFGWSRQQNTCSTDESVQ